MIAISTKERQFELRWSFSIAWLLKVAGLINSLTTFDDIRAIERRKQAELHEAGLNRW